MVSEGSRFGARVRNLALKVPCKSSHLAGLLGYESYTRAMEVYEFKSSSLLVQRMWCHIFDDDSDPVRVLVSLLLVTIQCVVDGI
jgi:hypothetical protein